MPLADHIPLKQGLRQFEIVHIVSEFWTLADHIPLKQGLRPLSSDRDSNILISQTIFH